MRPTWSNASGPWRTTVGPPPAPRRVSARTRASSSQRERLGHVVVGAEVEALDALVDAVGGRQDQHGQVELRARRR
jgi:hypothetical protein